MGRSGNKLKIALSLLLVVLGVASRTVLSRNFAQPWIPLFGNNIEIVTVIGVVAGLILGIRFGWIVPLAVMVCSDLLIGNDSMILPFTWTGFVIPAVIGGIVARVSQRFGESKKPMVASVGGFGGSLFSVLFFFVWTNFGVWLFWYPKTLEGLIRCYTLALPFLANQLRGSFLVGGIIFGGFLLLSVLFKVIENIRKHGAFSCSR